MSPDGSKPARKATIASSLYTVILALAFGTVLATAVFVAYKCYFQYDTLFKIP